MGSSKRVVVQLKAFIGDAVMAMPLLESLREQADTFVAAPALIGQVLGPEWADHFIPIQGRGFLPRLAAVRSARADISIVLNRSFRSALVARAAGIKQRVGHNVEGRGFLLTQRVEFDPQQHEVESYLDLVRATGFETPTTRPHLAVSEPEIQRGAELASGARIALQPGARHAYKQLPFKALSAIADTVHEAGERLILIGGGDESEAAERFLSEAKVDCVNLVGKTTLRETLGILANCKLAVGSDTGVMHLAAAIGCPTVTVFEPSQPPTRWGHLYPPHRIVESPTSGIEDLKIASLESSVREALIESNTIGSQSP